LIYVNSSNGSYDISAHSFLAGGASWGTIVSEYFIEEPGWIPVSLLAGGKPGSP
jgi:hypothetical protein